MRYLALLTLALAALLAACGGPQPQTPSLGVRLQIVATTGMIADSARRIAGDAADVKALMGPGTDPHLYKATASDVTTLQRADVVLYNGLNLEGKMGDVLAALGRAGKPVVAVGDRLEKSRLLQAAQGHPDPHIWFDVEMWADASGAIVDALVKARPEQADGFRERGAAWQKELRELHAWCLKEAETVPPERRVLVTSHDAFEYFGRAYGFDVIGLQGISTVTEAGMNDVTSLVDEIKKRKVPAVFVESSVPRAALERVSQDSGARVGGELFSDAMGAEGSAEGTYPGMIRHNVSTIVGALK